MHFEKLQYVLKFFGKPGAPGFFKSLVCGCQYACVCLQAIIHYSREVKPK